MSSYPRTTRRTWSLSRQTELFTTQSHGPQKSPGLKADQAHRPSALSTVSEGSQTESFFTEFNNHSSASRGQSPATRRTLTSNSYMQTDHLTLTSGHGVFVYFFTQAEAETQTRLQPAVTGHLQSFMLQLVTKGQVCRCLGRAHPHPPLEERFWV